MANPQPILSRRTVIFAEIEQETDTVASWNAGTRTVTLNGGSWLSSADSEIGREVIVYDGVPSSAAGASANGRTVISDNGDSTAKTIQLLESPSFTPASSDVVSVPKYASSSVDPSATAGNAILCTLPELTFNGEFLKRDYTKKSLTPAEGVMGNRSVNISFSCELKGNGGGGGSALPTLNELDPLLRACGFQRIDDATGTNYNRVYKPASEAFESVCLDVFADGLKWTLRGCVGNATFKLEQGKVPMIDFEFSALYADADDVAIPTWTVDSSLPAITSYAGLQGWGSSDLPASTLEFSLNNEITEYLNMSKQALGDPERYMITNRAPSGSFNPQAELAAAEPWAKRWADGTASGTFQCKVAYKEGGLIHSGKSMKIVFATKAQASSLGFADDGGIRRFDWGFDIATELSNADDDFKIIMY